jgi:hypothetical protein
VCAAMQVEPISLADESGIRGRMQLWKRRGDDWTSPPLVSEVDGRTLPLMRMASEKGYKDTTGIRPS